MLLNLAAVANSEDPVVLWGFLRRYAPAASPEKFPRLDRMIGYAVRLFPRFREAEEGLSRRRRGGARGARKTVRRPRQPAARTPAPKTIQTLLYDVARPIRATRTLAAKGATPERPGVSNDWFNMLYQVLLGEDRGPRFGSFAALYGVDNTRALIADALAGKFLKRKPSILTVPRPEDSLRLATPPDRPVTRRN